MKNKELDLVKKIRGRAAEARRGPPPLLGIGDDAAVLAPWPRDRELLITTDLAIEGVHFDRTIHPARALGHKVLARGISDIAAMGGEPQYALLSLCLPHWAAENWQKQFLEGLFSLAGRHGVRIIGGDLAAGDRLAADITVLGWTPRGRRLERGKAKTGDIIYVSGYLGGSALGLDRLRAGASPAAAAPRRHLYPSPRVALGRFLAGRLGARAAMDLSDGLSLDLYRLTRESRVGAEIHAARIPVFPGATLDQALHGGEDYELLFTLDPARTPPAAYQGLALTAIGLITRTPSLTLVGSDGRRRKLPVRGFQHRIQ